MKSEKTEVANGLSKRWDLLFRYRLIEIVAQWEGRLTTNHLCENFGIGRQQASRDINAYMACEGKGNLVYDRHMKGYKPSPTFVPRFTAGTADEYLHVLSRNKDIIYTFDNLNMGFVHTQIIGVPVRSIEPLILRPLIQAARTQKRVEISYVSLANPVAETRIIAPHTLVCTPLRWHVRAYCEKNHAFRDFVLSRFREVNGMLDESPMTVAQDEQWQHEVNLILCPDPRLNLLQQNVIARDYDMENGRLVLTERAALIPYMLQVFNIDPLKLEGKPEAQQIVIQNRNEIEDYLF